MELALAIALLVVCAILTTVITMQTNRGDGMSSAVTGQAGGYAAKNRNGSRDDVLKTVTIVTSVVFVVLVVLVNLFVLKA